VSGALPGSVHDKKAEWIWGVLAELEAGGLVTLGDKGSSYAKIPYKGKNKPASQKRPIGPTRSSARPARARTPSSSPGASSASCAAAPGEPGRWPRRFTFSRSARPEDEGSGTALSPVAVQQVAQCAAGGDERGGHQVEGHPRDAGEVARLVFDVGAGDGQRREERHPGGRG